MKKYLLSFFCFFLSLTPYGVYGNGVILVSVPPYQEMVKQVAGNRFEVLSVVPTGVDPHQWEPSYKDIGHLDKGFIWFTIGESFEGNLARKLKSANPQLEVVSLADCVKKISSSCCSLHALGADTHFWLSPLAAIEQAEIIETTLSRHFPEQSKAFKSNFAALKRQLTLLNEKSALALTPFKGDIIVTSHGAFTYYANAYNLEQLVIEPEDGKEPGTRAIVDLTKKIETMKPQVIGLFLEPQHSNKAAKMLARSLDLPTFMIDPYAENYIQTIEDLTQIVVKNGKRPPNHRP